MVFYLDGAVGKKGLEQNPNAQILDYEANMRCPQRDKPLSLSSGCIDR